MKQPMDCRRPLDMEQESSMQTNACPICNPQDGCQEHKVRQMIMEELLMQAAGLHQEPQQLLVLAQWEGQDDQITRSLTEEAIMVSQQGMAWAKPSHMVLMIHGIELSCFLRTSTVTLIFTKYLKSAKI